MEGVIHNGWRERFYAKNETPISTTPRNHRRTSHRRLFCCLWPNSQFPGWDSIKLVNDSFAKMPPSSDPGRHWILSSFTRSKKTTNEFEPWYDIIWLLFWLRVLCTQLYHHSNNFFFLYNVVLIRHNKIYLFYLSNSSQEHKWIPEMYRQDWRKTFF